MLKHFCIATGATFAPFVTVTPLIDRSVAVGSAVSTLCGQLQWPPLLIKF
jgi:hypothetical protein